MNFWKDYRAYVLDNPKGYWFKAKPYGWGWTPVTWQGWLVVGLYVAFVVWQALGLERLPEEDLMATKTFLLRIGLALCILIAIAYRTGEPPRWMWHLPQSRPTTKRGEQFRPVDEKN